MTFYKNNIGRVQSYDMEVEAFELPQIPHKQKHSKSTHQPARIIANVSDTQYDVVLDVCERSLGWKLQFEWEERHWDVMWTDHAVTTDMLIKMEQHQKINHFPGMSNLSRKNLLARNLQKMQQQFQDDYDYFPKTWLLPHDYHKLRNYTNEIRRMGISKCFIVKPEASSQGRGIFLTKNLGDIPEGEHCVVQRYITSPLLFQGLKFDLRVYVLVAGCDPLRLYIYNEGLVRLATEPYSRPNMENLDNMYVHLTNYAINKDNPNFVQNKSEADLNYGHKRSLADFFQTLKKKGVNSGKIWSQIKEIIVKTMISGQPHLAHEFRMCQPHNLSNDMCFEILGFDVMIDEDQKVWLIEINHTPSFSCQSPLDELVKSNLIRDTLVLMNISLQNRESTIKRVKQAQQIRVLTGKTLRFDKQHRMKVVHELQNIRDDYEDAHLGSFQRIFPINDQEKSKKYQEMLEYCQNAFSSPTKFNRKSPVPSLSKPKKHRKVTWMTTMQSQDIEDQVSPPKRKPTPAIMLPRMSQISRDEQTEKDIRSILQENKHKQMQLASIGGHLINLPREETIFKMQNSYGLVQEEPTMFSRYTRKR